MKHFRVLVAGRIQKGFTLIELMVVVAVVAILAAIVMPAYSDYLVRGRIPDATSNLANMRVQMEQYFQDNRRYSTVAGGVVCGAANPTSNNSPATFIFTCVATNTSFTATATGAGSMAGFTYTINEQNAKATTAAPAAWAAAAMPTSCWITKKGGAC